MTDHRDSLSASSRLLACNRKRPTTELGVMVSWHN